MAEARPRRLIEVDLPIGRISEHARREKSIRHGHISTLHIWWARRPLASCRAVILAALLPDPADEACSLGFRQAATAALRSLPRKTPKVEDGQGLRRALLDFIADFADWDRSADRDYLAAARALVRAAYPDAPPTVLDPFAGGGAMPLEALRVGAMAEASDLNPVAVLLEKVVLEYVPRHGDRLAEGVSYWGRVVKERAREELAAFYPLDPDGAVPIAYIWARTALCEGPACGARVPLMRGMWLSKRAGHYVALKLVVVGGKVDFMIQENVRPADVGGGTVQRGSLTCPVCGFVTPVVAIRTQARRQGLPERLIAVVTTRPTQQGRHYRLPEESDLRAVSAAQAELAKRKAKHVGSLSLVPDEPFPADDSRAFTPGVYGVKTWGELFTSRQLLTLTTLARLVREVRAEIADSVGDPHLAGAVTTCLGLAVDRAAESESSLCRWNPVGEKLQATFGRQALPMVWDFAEAYVFGGSVGDWDSLIDNVLIAVETAKAAATAGATSAASATDLAQADRSVDLLATDPPYYDAVPYADLSDFFYVWLRRSIGKVHPDLLSTMLTPKAAEIVVNPASEADGRPKTRSFFESHMALAFTEARRVLGDDGVGVVVFAHKSTAGWEAMLQALVGAGWTVTGSWPIDTEMGSRLRAMNSAALASSIHLVCRPRVAGGVGDWSSILRQLQPRTDAWMKRLAEEGVVGADAIFACLGPAVELYSRYDRVETAAGATVPLGGRATTGDDFLSHVWAAIAQSALRRIFDEAQASGFEADARLAAVWLWTAAAGKSAIGEPTDEEPPEDDQGAEATATPARGGFVLPYDTARKLAQPLGADIDEISRRPGAPFEVKGANARMLPVVERRRFLLDGVTPAPGTRRRGAQASLFSEEEIGGPGGGVPSRTGTLDRVNQAMLLFADDRADSLRRLLVEDGAGADERFWRLAGALSALYPRTSPEKRWVDGVLARKRALGL